MIRQTEIDRELRRIPVGTTSSIYGIPVTKISVNDPSMTGTKLFKYAVRDAPKPLRIGPAVRLLSDMLVDYDGDE